MSRAFVVFGAMVLAGGCGGLAGGSEWMKEPLTPDGREASGELETGAPAPRAARPRSRTLGRGAREGERTGGGGRVLGTFRNTYYDFPREADHQGQPAVAVMSPSCEPIARVSRSFYEALCVQGSGSLRRGGTVSFAKRDCACAEVCPRTGQRICFDALDPRTFPFGRGATGKPITPLRTVAADTSVLPMGTVVYIPELDGVPREDGQPIDGCFVVEDRGLRVRGQHVDIFTGSHAETGRLGQRVPSNQGVTVVVDAPRCAHLHAHARR